MEFIKTVMIGYKSMKKRFIRAIIILLLVLIILSGINKANAITRVDLDFIQIAVNHVDEMFYINELPLTYDEQLFIYYHSITNNLPYELVLGVIKLESNFDKDIVSHTNDYGIMQININYVDWYAELAELEDYSILDFHDNVLMGIGGLSFYMTYYKSLEVCDTLLWEYVLNSYNMGINGYNRYIRNTQQYSRAYSRIILENKLDFKERGN